MSGQCSETELNKIYDMLDANHDGKVTIEDIKTLGASKDDFKCLLKAFDADGDNIVSRKEFIDAIGKMNKGGQQCRK